MMGERRKEEQNEEREEEGCTGKKNGQKSECRMTERRGKKEKEKTKKQRNELQCVLIFHCR